MVRMTMAQWQTLSDRINQVAPSATLAVDSKAKAMKAAGIDVVGFGAGEPNFPTPDYVVDAAAEAVRDPKNYRYTPTPGLPELREAIAAKTLRDSGYEVDPAQVVVTNGGKQAVYSIFQVLLNEGDEVIIPAPYWTSYPEAVKLAGGVPVEVFVGAERGFEPDMDALEAARTERTKAIIVTSPNNPTGAVWSPETIKRIGEWAVEHHIWIISDEIYEHLNYDDAHTTYIGAAVPECRDQLVVLNGVAKTYAMPGWRVGWMVAPLEVAKAANKLQGHMTSNVANVSQRAALAAVAGTLDAVYAMREAFDVRRKAIVAALNDIPGVVCPTPTGAFYAFADIHGLLGKPLGPNGTVSETSAEFAAALLDEAHVAAVPGEAFGAPGYLRFSYALADDQLAEGMRRFKAYVEA
ncbi:aspartate aminotransferase [Bifidobacterium lemurum]|uniref:Aminotransferase n=2 Tax=Bifidobacterium lemurum TaxID=1603886 RepID=A0A261FNA3_9BIFI|nr:aspartate aminotransferase [Bifidobacterium lemurum]